MRPALTTKRTILIAANVVALATTFGALLVMAASRGTDFAGYGTGIAALLLYGAGGVLTLVLVLAAGIRGESPWWAYLSPFASLALFFALGYFFFD
jgi:hypothetical protein